MMPTTNVDSLLEDQERLAALRATANDAIHNHSVDTTPKEGKPAVPVMGLDAPQRGPRMGRRAGLAPMEPEVLSSLGAMPSVEEEGEQRVATDEGTDVEQATRQPVNTTGVKGGEWDAGGSARTLQQNEILLGKRKRKGQTSSDEDGAAVQSNS